MRSQTPLIQTNPPTQSVALVNSDSPTNSPAAAKILRAMGRLLLFCGTLAWVALDFAVRIWLAGNRHDIHARCAWMARSARAMMKCVNLRAEYIGTPPRTGLFVSNHLSYLDILVFGARQPAVFVAKADVRNWPALGYLAKLAGTLFVRRERRADVSPLNVQLSALLKAGVVVIVFPEGTSSDGRQVLPFYSSLLEPGVRESCTITPAFIRYELTDDWPADEVCYWRDMKFGPHFLNLLTKREIRATLRIGTAREAGQDRKQLARELHAAVCRLGEV